MIGHDEPEWAPLRDTMTQKGAEQSVTAAAHSRQRKWSTFTVSRSF